MSPTLRSGLISAFGAYLIWGILPLFLKVLQADGIDNSLEIVCHRILWGIPFVLGYIIWSKRLTILRASMASPRLWLSLVVTSALIGGNWFLYTWAVQANHLLDASLGYYINPLVNVLLGTLLLREPMRRLQWVAFGLACLGVINQGIAIGGLPWISLALCFSFAIYGLIKKKMGLDASVGFFMEILIMLPLVLYFLLSEPLRTHGHFGTGWDKSFLLILVGPISAVPLILFSAAAKKLRLSTLGFIQYLAPTLAFGVGLLYGEPFTHAYAITFSLIWLALALYSFDAVRAETERRAVFASGRDQ